MSNNVIRIVPSLTANLVTKVLALEVYFLLRLGKSPAYFTLTDFLNNYSIEILYISVLLFLLSPWFFAPAMLVYYAFAGSAAWVFRRALNLIKWGGIPVFRALYERDRDSTVSITVAKDFAKSNGDADLLKRIELYEVENRKSLEGEAISTVNFALTLVIALISSQGSPNFLMKVTEFLEIHLNGHAYHMVLLMLIIQGVIGRASSFHLLKNSGILPYQFFKNNAERAASKEWALTMIKRNEPMAFDWLNRSK